MAISGCMQCLKTCGYLCGTLAALNIWFWLGMTVFNALGNPWITKEILMKESYTDPDADRFTTVFAACILVSKSNLYQSAYQSRWHFLFQIMTVKRALHGWMLLVHLICVLQGPRPGCLVRGQQIKQAVGAVWSCERQWCKRQWQKLFSTNHWRTYDTLNS